MYLISCCGTWWLYLSVLGPYFYLDFLYMLYLRLAYRYEPEIFPGLIYRIINPKLVFLIFVNGKVIITGMPFLASWIFSFTFIFAKVLLPFVWCTGLTVFLKLKKLKWFVFMQTCGTFRNLYFADGGPVWVDWLCMLVVIHVNALNIFLVIRKWWVSNRYILSTMFSCPCATL